MLDACHHQSHTYFAVHWWSNYGSVRRANFPTKKIIELAYNSDCAVRVLLHAETAPSR
ncbi:hypothetical protein BVIET440_250050 [Burkholderia vietnamiensis]